MDVDKVHERTELAEFVRELAAEVRSGEFENATLESFLEALSGWIEDMDGYFSNIGENTPAQPDWRLVAMMLRAATVYE